VRKPDDKENAKPQVQVTTAFDARNDYQQMSTGLGLSELKPGSYVLMVTLKEKGKDRSTTRKQALNILEK
jgi:hypothetical protein